MVRKISPLILKKRFRTVQQQFFWIKMLMWQCSRNPAGIQSDWKFKFIWFWRLIEIHYKKRAKANNAQRGKERIASKNRGALWRRSRGLRTEGGWRGWEGAKGGSVGERSWRRERICLARAVPTTSEQGKHKEWAVAAMEDEELWGPDGEVFINILPP